MLPNSSSYGTKGSLALTKCGKKTRKNSAVFTFNASITMPSRKAQRTGAGNEASDARAGRDGENDGGDQESGER